jgi:hypothetical protein
LSKKIETNAATSTAAASVVNCRIKLGIEASIEVENAYHGLTEISIGKPDTDGLVNKENICIGVPRFWMDVRAVFVNDPARSFAKIGSVGYKVS